MTEALASKFILLLLIVNNLMYIAIGGLSKQRLMVRVDRLEVCYRNPEIPSKMKYFNIKYTPDIGYSLDVEVELLRDLDNEKIWGLMRVERCASREALDTCEPFAVLRPPIHICHFLNMKGMGMDAVINSFVPTPKCPLKKGTFTGKNVIFNPDLFTMFPITGFYWKIQGDSGEGDKLLASICFEGSVVKSRGSGSYNISIT